MRTIVVYPTIYIKSLAVLLIKQGYDFGMTIYCEVNHPEEEIEAHE